MAAPLSSVELLSAHYIQGTANQLPTMFQLFHETASSADLTRAFSRIYWELMHVYSQDPEIYLNPPDYPNPSLEVPPYMSEIMFKWYQWNSGPMLHNLEHHPAGVVRVLLLDIWRDWLMVWRGFGEWFIDHTGFVFPNPGTAIGAGVVGGAANVNVANADTTNLTAPHGGAANAGGPYGLTNAGAAYDGLGNAGSPYGGAANGGGIGGGTGRGGIRGRGRGAGGGGRRGAGDTGRARGGRGTNAAVPIFHPNGGRVMYGADASQATNGWQEDTNSL